MFGLGIQELLIILLIAFFVFGGKKLPEIGAGLGKGLKAFKSGLNVLMKFVGCMVLREHIMEEKFLFRVLEWECLQFQSMRVSLLIIMM